MAFVSKFRPSLIASLVIASSAILFWFGNGLNPFWPLLWFAPLPVLWYALRNAAWRAGLVAGLSCLVGCLNLWGYMHSQGTPFSAWLMVFSIAALVFALAVLLFRALILRGALWTGLIALPATWVAYEFLRNLTTPHATAASFAYSQLKFLPVLQLASITGPWGITFIVLLVPSAIAIWLHLRTAAAKRSSRVLIATGGVLAVVLVFGAVRLLSRHSGPEIKVGLIASDEPANVEPAKNGGDAERLFSKYADQAKALAAQGAQVIVLPEKIALQVDSDNAGPDSIFQTLADQANATIVVGEVHITPTAKYNQARVYAPHSPVLAYNKHHMLPPFESNLTVGTSWLELPRASQTWGVAICKDMDFTPLSRRYGRDGVGMMLVPAWDFNRDRTWHGHMAIMRGVEDGFTVARAAKNGYLTLSDDRGRILAEARSDSAPFATVLADAPVTHDSTIYLVLGDWFGWFAFAALAFSIIQVLRTRRLPHASHQRNSSITATPLGAGWSGNTARPGSAEIHSRPAQKAR